MKRVNVYDVIREMREQIVNTMQERGIKEMQTVMPYKEWGKEQNYTDDDYEEEEDDDDDYTDYKNDEAPYAIFFDKYGTGYDYLVDKVTLKQYKTGDHVLEFDCYNNELGSDTFSEDDLAFLTLYNVYDRMFDLLGIEDEPDAHTLTLPYAVGDRIKWHCDDDGKVRTSKVQRVECEIDEHGPVFTYYVRTKWNGQMVMASVTYADIIND